MSFKQIRQNAARNRKDNGLFFSSLVIAIVAFYTLLSLGNQDVMRFLRTVESDAVQKLMLLIPIVYIISLFFVFFLVYFAYRYQLENRKKEFGLYLLFGMKRSVLFMMLIGETVWNSFISILVGLPIALLLTEIISLTTIKLIGLGIIGHKISFSIPAILGTVFGFAAVQIISMVILSISFSRKELLELLKSDSQEKQRPSSPEKNRRSLILGIIFLISSYTTGIILLRSLNFLVVLIILILGGLGTFLFFRGLGGYIGRNFQQKSLNRAGLFTFTGRQIQENVLHQYRALAVSSLLLLMSLAFVSFGIGISVGQGSAETRTVDFSIDGNPVDVITFLEDENNQPMISGYYPMYLDSMNINRDESANTEAELPEGHTLSWTAFIQVLNQLPETNQRNNLIMDFSDTYSLYLISESSFNHLLSSIEKTPLNLESNQAALYTSLKDSQEFNTTLNQVLKSGVSVELDGKNFELLPQLYDENLVADRYITLYKALIVPDQVYQNLVYDPETPFCWNMMLDEEFVNQNGLMAAIQIMEQNLNGTELIFESYLKGIGRNLFYTIAGSYLSIYLGFLFMVIANTVISLKYLIQQRENKHRYLTLLSLGADINDLCQSARTQIRLYFSLVLSLALCSSIFAIWSMFTSFLRLPAGTSLVKIVVIAGISLILFVVIECVYMTIVERISNRELLSLQIFEKGTL